MGGGVRDFANEPHHENESLVRVKKNLAEEKARSKKQRDELDKEKARSKKQRDELDKEKARSKQQRNELDKEKARIKQQGKELSEEKEKLEHVRKEFSNRVDQLQKGTEPEFTPSEEDIHNAKRDTEYDKSNIHIAIAGAAGSGKSSLINAFRGIMDKDIMEGAAATDTDESTLKIGRYPDPDPSMPFKRCIWFDIPGSGTQRVNAWEYTKSQHLYIFDTVLVVVGERFMESDINILKHCNRFGVPTFIVRSKADRHIEDIQKKKHDNDDFDDDDDAYTPWYGPRAQSYHSARKEFITKTKASVERELDAAGLPQQRVYIVTNRTIRLISLHLHSTGKRLRSKASLVADEEELFKDLLEKTYARRYRDLLTLEAIEGSPIDGSDLDSDGINTPPESGA